MRIDISSSSILGEAGKENFFACQEACKKYGFDFGVQLHNTSDDEIIDYVRKSGVKFTVHSPIRGDYSLNLSTRENLPIIFQAFEDNYAFLKEIGVDLTVFHGFAMTDILIGSMKSQADYAKNLSLLKRDDLKNAVDSVINNDFTKLPEYFERFEALKDNLKIVREKFPDVIFSIENDLPVYGYGGMKLSDMVKLEHPLCIDIGHLWVSSLAIDFDYYRELEIGLAESDVRMIHFHNSVMTHKTPKNLLTDGHLGISEKNELDLQKSFNLMRKYGIDYLVLEITKCSVADIRTIAEFIGA